MHRSKIISLLALIYFLSSCGTAGDYYAYKDGGEWKSHTTLHKDEKIFVHINHFDGRISSVTIYQNNPEEKLDFHLNSQQISLFEKDDRIGSSSRNDTQRILQANPETNVLAQFTEVYQIEVPIESVIEKIDIDLLVDQQQIQIKREFPLKRVTYNYFQALMGI